MDILMRYFESVEKIKGAITRKNPLQKLSLFLNLKIHP